MTAQIPPSQATDRPFPKLRAVPGSGRPLPAEETLAEAAVLAACLLDPGKVAALDWLAPEHFFLGMHAQIWAALLAVAPDAPPGEPCLVLVALALKTSGHLAEVGGVAALGQLVDLTPSVGEAQLQACAEAVHAAHQQRQIGAWASSLSATARTSPTAPDALLEGAASALADLQAQGRAGQPPGVLLGDAAAAWVDSLDAPEAASSVLSTGFRTLDGLAGGMGRGNLWVLGGRPGMGKTALAQCVAMNVAWAQESVAFFSLEMSRAELSARSLASESGVPSSGAPTPEVKAALREATARIKRLPLWIDDTPGLPLAELQRRAKLLAARSRAKGRRLALVVVDYLQLVSVPHVPGRKTSDEIAEVSKALKVLARHLDCPVLALAQLNRSSESEGRRPRMTDFRDCGQIEQDADWAGILWRRKDTPEWQVDLAVCKQRKGPKNQDLKLGWQPELTRFDDG